MRAAYYEQNGAARDVLHVDDVDTPQAGPGEVRVKLATSGVNPSDVKSRQGTTRKIAWPRLIPQSDGAGVIDQVGDGIAKSRIGERVWIWNGQWKRAFGTAAEYIALPAAQAVKLPDKIDFAAGACLGIPAMTAVHAIALAGADKGSTVLVAGGAGSVGQYDIQFAKALGATVLATVSSPEKAAAAREAGADHTIDYKREDVGERVMDLTGKRGVDAVIEHVGGDVFAKSILATAWGGRVVTCGATAGFKPDLDLRQIFFRQVQVLGSTMGRKADLLRVLQFVEQGKLRPVVDRVMSLREARAAHEALENRATFGKIVLRVD